MKRLGSYLLFPVVLGAALYAGSVAFGRGVSPALTVALIGAMTVLVVAVFERILPYRAAWNRSRGDVLTDLAHGVVSNLAAPEVYKHLLLLFCLPLSARIAGWIGFQPWPHRWPLVAQLGLALVVAELGQYWAHRFAHERDLLWRLHAVHHSPSRLYWLNAGRDHPLGLLLLFTFENVPLMLLGAGERVLAFWIVVTVVVGLFQHCNIDVRLGPLNYIFSNAELHRWHHAKEIRHANHNYGSNLSVWDVVFGTWYLPDRPPPEELGISDMPRFPGGYLRQLLVPLTWRSLRER